MKKIINLLLVTVAMLGLVGCSDDDSDSSLLSILANIFSIGDNGLGWLSDDEDYSTIEDAITITVTDDSELSEVTDGLPSSVDNSGYLPSVGNQGSYGTCVAWATAYYGRTWLYAKNNNLKTSQLTTKTTFSAPDMFKSIDSSSKGTECQGSNFDPAMKKMISRGICPIAYADDISTASDCDSDPSSTATSYAASYKIKSYRQIDHTTASTLKRYLNEGHIVIFGAKLGDNFMYCSDASVIMSNGTFTSTGQHAYHAITLVGYDDSKGSNGAFKVVNSWGTSWGSSGYCWIDQDFFCSGDFAYSAFVMYDTDDNTTLGASYSASTYDLQPYKVTDEDYYAAGDEDSDDPRWRTLTYDVLNAGTETVTADMSWATCYLLYNAYNANEYEIVLCDLYTSELGGVAKGEFNDNWSTEEAYSILGLEAQGFAISNVDVEPNQTTSEAVSGLSDSYFQWSYKLPDVTGSYYLVLLADAFGSVDESNEDNNYYFLMTSAGGPLTLTNGVIQESIGNNKATLVRQSVRPSQNATLENQTAVNSVAINTYSPEEIAGMIRAEKKSGRLRNKVATYVESGEKNVKMRVIKQ